MISIDASENLSKSDAILIARGPGGANGVNTPSSIPAGSGYAGALAPDAKFGTAAMHTWFKCPYG
jgi:hypothetical protein